MYNKETLKRHLESGDESGPLAESGFKGHPLCKFCRQRFYDSNELYKHMESAHEHCFLCRRAAPHQYVYFRHYKELEGEGACRLVGSGLAVVGQAHSCQPRLAEIAVMTLLPSHSALTWSIKPQPATAYAASSLSCRPLHQGAPPVPAPALPGEQVCGVRH